MRALVRSSVWKWYLVTDASRSSGKLLAQVPLLKRRLADYLEAERIQLDRKITQEGCCYYPCTGGIPL